MLFVLLNVLLFLPFANLQDLSEMKNRRRGHSGQMDSNLISSDQEEVSMDALKEENRQLEEKIMALQAKLEKFQKLLEEKAEIDKQTAELKEELLRATNESADLLGDLESWTETVRNIEKKFSPFALSVYQNRTSKKQLTILHRETHEIWSELIEFRIESSKYSLKNMAVTKDFEKMVDWPLHTISQRTHSLMNPKHERDEEALNDFKASCLDKQTSPREIVNWLRQVLVDNCAEGMSQDEIKKIADARSIVTDALYKISKNLKNDDSCGTAVRKFLTGFGNDDAPAVGNYLTEIKRIMNKVDSATLKNEINEMEGPFSSYDDGMRTLFSKNEKKSREVGRENRCVLAEIVGESFLHNVTLEFFGRKLKYQLITLAYASTVCNVFIHDNNKPDMERYSAHITSAVEKIGTKVPSFMRGSVKNIWPHVTLQVAKERLLLFESGDKRSPFSNLYDVAHLMQDDIRAVGMEDESIHEILISHKVDEFTPLLTNWCISDSDSLGFILVICRQKAPNSEENGELRDRMARLKRNFGDLKTKIETVLDDQNCSRMFSENIGKILTSLNLNETSEGIIGQDSYHGLAILRNWQHFGEAKKIVRGYANFRDIGFAIDTVTSLRLNRGSCSANRHYSYDFIFFT